MKTNAWSLAFLAGGALVAADGWDNWSETSSSVASTTTSSTPISAVQSSTTSSSSSSSTPATTSSSSSSSSSSVASSSAVASSSSVATWSEWVSSSSVVSSSTLSTSSSVSTSTGSAVQSSSSVYSSGVSSSSSAISTGKSSTSTGSAVQSSSSSVVGWGQWTSSSAFSTGASSSSSVASTGSAKQSSSSVASSGFSKSKSIYSTGSAVQSSSTSSHEGWGAWSETSAVSSTFEYKPTTPVTTSTSTTYITKVTTVYTTVSPVLSTWTSAQQTGVWSSLTTATITKVYTSTITAPVSPVSSSPAGPVGPASSGCAQTLTTVIGGTTLTSTVQSTLTVTSTIKSTITIGNTPVGPVSTVVVTPVPVYTTPYTTVTQFTTQYTTVVPVSKGATELTTKTLSGVFLSTVTYGPSQSAETWSTEAPISVVPWGTQTLTYALTQPITFQSSPTAPAVPTWANWGNWSPNGTAGGKSGSAVSGKPSKTGKGTGTAIVTGYATSSSAVSTPTSAVCIPCEGQPGSDPANFCGYTINDNSYLVTPKTCRTVYYDFVLTNTTVAPDGVPRIGLLINNQFPGPLIEANWGDTIVVTLHNQLQDNGTSIHFHGMRQLNSNEMDGVPSITQCPLAPGQSQTYSFVADNYGTSWYHSHFSLQIQDGLQGPMIIHGPASLPYDDEDMFVITDWNHVSLNELYDISQDPNNPNSGPPTLDTGLINGLNVWAEGTAAQSGSRYTMTVEQGKTYRLRLVHTGAQTSFKFYIDQHTFQVIAVDYVPITPYSTNILSINCGQRYDIIFKADQAVGNYWARADGQNICMALKNPDNIKAIISYVGAGSAAPTSTAVSYTPKCEDEPLASLVPVVPLAAGNQDVTINENVIIGANGGNPNLYKWTLSGTTFVSQWDSPTLNGIVNTGSAPTYSGNLAISVPKLGEWVYLIIESPIPLPHPIHLHGHDFMILAQGYGSYSASTPLNTVNPARRDTALMPAYQGQAGYLVIAFETDNPGAWLLHCHIIWHAAMGFALQIIEGLDSIKDTVKFPEANNEVCENWHSWDVANNYDLVPDDSGI